MVAYSISTRTVSCRIFSGVVPQSCSSSGKRAAGDIFPARMEQSARRRVLFLLSRAGGFLSLFSLVSLSVRGTDIVHQPLRIAFFYNATLFTDDPLRASTEALLNDGTNVQVVTLPYKRASEFRTLYYDHVLRQSNSWDLLLGPTESGALKELSDSVDTRQNIPFVAPFITTLPKAYRRVLLVPACPSDEERIEVAVNGFVQYAAPRLMALLHADNFWGQTMVKSLRAGLSSQKTIVHAQPVEEFAEDDAGEETVGADNKRLYVAFLERMREYGATVIGVALLTPEAYNQFLDTLHDFNTRLLVGYKPTILLLSQPGFHPERSNEGVLYKHLAEFNIFYIADCVKGPAPDMASRNAFLAQLDACRVIAHTARELSRDSDSSDWRKDAVKHVLDFYKGAWKEEEAKSIYADLQTGYHAAKLHIPANQIEMRQAMATSNQLKEQSVSDYFRSDYLGGICYSTRFFLFHHRVLWNGWLVVLFALVALLSFYHASKMKSQRPAWMLLTTGSFWSLFVLNLLLSYGMWVLSIYFGLLGDTNLAAPLVLAAACPTAGSALGDVARRYLPFDVTGILRVIEDLNNKLLETVGKEKIEEYKARLQQLSLDLLKGVFFEVLFLELTSDDLRNRILDQFHKTLARQQGDLDKLQQGAAGMSDDMLKENREKLERKAYAGSLLNALAYLCSNENEVGAHVERLLLAHGQASAAAPAQPGLKAND